MALELYLFGGLKKSPRVNVVYISPVHRMDEKKMCITKASKYRLDSHEVVATVTDPHGMLQMGCHI